MRLSLLGVLGCPDCGGDLKFAVLDAYPRHDQEVEAATLGCTRCAREFPVEDGVPRLRANGAPEPRRAAAADARERGSLPAEQQALLDATLLGADDFAGKLVLDASGGAGRRAVVARSLGADLVVLDSFAGLKAVAERAKEDPRLHPVEGDLARPPFKAAVFDAAVCLDALSRENLPRASFKALAATVKSRGALAVRVAGRAGSYAEFSSNPPEPGEKPRRGRLAWLAAVFAGLGRPRGATKDELSRWFLDEGFVVHRVRVAGLVPAPSALGRKGR